tara:strand:+ start:326 stop:634 length:309 start_codon:yes stop_codon:yes gene_type:complete
MIDFELILSQAKEMDNKVRRFKITTHSESETNEFNEKMVQEFKYLHDNVSSIFKLINMGSFDFKKLEYMIGMAKQIEDKKITEYDASVKVGTVLVKDFVENK